MAAKSPRFATGLDMCTRNREARESHQPMAISLSRVFRENWIRRNGIPFGSPLPSERGFTFLRPPLMLNMTSHGCECSQGTLWWTPFRWRFMSTNHFGGRSLLTFMASHSQPWPDADHLRWSLGGVAERCCPAGTQQAVPDPFFIQRTV